MDTSVGLAHIIVVYGRMMSRTMREPLFECSHLLSDGSGVADISQPPSRSHPPPPAVTNDSGHRHIHTRSRRRTLTRSWWVTIPVGLVSFLTHVPSRVVVVAAFVRAIEVTPDHDAPLSPPQPQQQQFASLYLAESSIHPGLWSVYTGRAVLLGSDVAPPDVVLPIRDAMHHEWSPWHDYVMWSAAEIFPPWMLESEFRTDLVVAGLSNHMVHCSNRYANIYPANPYFVPTNTSTRVAGSTAVAPSSVVFGGFTALRDLMPGEELFFRCNDEPTLPHRTGIDIHTLDAYGTALGSLTVAPSSLPSTIHTTTNDPLFVGNGAYTNVMVTQGSVVATSPVLHFDYSQLEIVQQQWAKSKTTSSLRQFDPWSAMITEPQGKTLRDPIRYHASRVLGHQIWMNYCFGREDSDVILFPYGPAVNYINHAPTVRNVSTLHHATTANVRLQWRQTVDPTDGFDFLAATSHELFSRPSVSKHALLVDYVAIRDILPGEEILLDYGDEWQAAFDQYLGNAQPRRPLHTNNNESSYVSAEEYRQRHDKAVFPTIKEQAMSVEVPSNIRTACYYSFTANDFTDRRLDSLSSVWAPANGRCLRHCDIMTRYEEVVDTQTGANATFYDVRMQPMTSTSTPDHCQGISNNGRHVTRVPQVAITYVDAPYTNELHGSLTAFRHLIGIPREMYPSKWLRQDPDALGDFVLTELKPNHLDTFRWKPSGNHDQEDKYANQIVTPNGHRVRLPDSVQQVLLEYCDRMQITTIFQQLTMEGNALPVGTDLHFGMYQDETWYLQRPDKNWNSNLQWFSPGGWDAHSSYLQALSAAGFDEVLATIGQALGLNSLVAFHVTFIAVSWSTKGYVHYDVTGTGAKTFNVIIPLIKANHTGPELDLREFSDDDFQKDPLRVGRYGYEHHVGAMMGDDCYHATSAVDYRYHKEMRMAATVYIAEITEENVDVIVGSFTQHYPPANRTLMLEWSGSHWNRHDPTKKLPPPETDHILRQPTGYRSAISNVWSGEGNAAMEYE